MTNQRNEAKRAAAPVRRSLRVAQPADAGRAAEPLRQVPGVIEVGIEPGTGGLRVTYDAAVLDFEALMRALEQAGMPLRHRRWDRIKAAWYGYLDHNARSNAASTGGACCGDPKDIYASRR